MGHTPKTRRPRRPGASRTPGFSVIELAIVLSVGAMLLAVTITVMSSHVSRQQDKKSSQRNATVWEKLEAYTATYGALPCPADVTTDITDPAFGRAQGDATNGCTGNFLTASDSVNVIGGAVPTQALGLPADAATNGQNHKLLYVIDRRQAVATAFAAGCTGKDAGCSDLKVRNNVGSAGRQIAPDPDVGTAPPVVLVLDTGPNGYGAFKNIAGGGENQLAAPAGETTAIEQANIAFTSTFIQTPKNVPGMGDDYVEYRQLHRLKPTDEGASSSGSSGSSMVASTSGGSSGASSGGTSGSTGGSSTGASSGGDESSSGTSSTGTSSTGTSSGSSSTSSSTSSTTSGGAESSSSSSSSSSSTTSGGASLESHESSGSGSTSTSTTGSGGSSGGTSGGAGGGTSSGADGEASDSTSGGSGSTTSGTGGGGSCNVTATPTTALVNTSVQFFANANFGGVVDHQWSIADAPNSSIVNTTFTTPGTHTVTLTMSNESGQSATCDATVEVTANYPRCEPQFNSLVCQDHSTNAWYPRPGWPQGYEFEVTEDWNYYGYILPKGKYYSMSAGNTWSGVYYATGLTLPGLFWMYTYIPNGWNYFSYTVGADFYCSGDGDNFGGGGGYGVDPWAENTFTLPGSNPPISVVVRPAC